LWSARKEGGGGEGGGGRRFEEIDKRQSKVRRKPEKERSSAKRDVFRGLEAPQNNS
jgi:hypothetical protein